MCIRDRVNIALTGGAAGNGNHVAGGGLFNFTGEQMKRIAGVAVKFEGILAGGVGSAGVRSHLESNLRFPVVFGNGWGKVIQRADGHAVHIGAIQLHLHRNAAGEIKDAHRIVGGGIIIP